jgi:hypothetical protein
LIDGDTRIVDLAEAHAALSREPGPGSVLAIVEGGDAALDRAREAVAKAPASAIVPRPDARLRAPIQPPPQMRDCLCFELHLKQAFAASRKLTAMQSPDPQKAIAEIERSGPPDAPPIFYKRPIYYKQTASRSSEPTMTWFGPLIQSFSISNSNSGRTSREGSKTRRRTAPSNMSLVIRSSTICPPGTLKAPKWRGGSGRQKARILTRRT